jgi:Tfp pilus assembly protein PilN
MQQINLYLPEFRPNREPLRTHHMLWGALAFFVLLCLASVLGNLRTDKLANEIQAKRAQTQQLEQQLTHLRMQVPPDRSEQLHLRIQELEDELQRRNDIAQAINTEAPGQQNGFSGQLTSLARASSEQLSLAQFSLQSGGRFVELSGVARSAEEVPAYLQRLLGEDSFANTRFGVIRLDTSDNGQLVKFDIRKASIEPSQTRGGR